MFLDRFEPNWGGVVVVESVTGGWIPVLGATIEDCCFQINYIEYYKKGRVRAIENIYQADIAECHVDLLAKLQVKANLVIRVLQDEKLWGLLIAH